MTVDLNRYRGRLLADLEASREALKNAAQSAKTVVLDQTSVGRLSRMDALQQQAMAQGMSLRLERRIQGLLAALARIDAGTYGQCCECGDDLPEARLEGDPAAVFCAACLRARESAS